MCLSELCYHLVCLCRDGATALHYASKKGYTEVARLLVDNGSDVNRQKKCTQTVNDDGTVQIIRCPTLQRLALMHVSYSVYSQQGPNKI